MANMINTNYPHMHYKNAGQAGKSTAAGKGNAANKQKDPLAQYGGDFSVELSSEGLAALASQRKQPAAKADDGSGALKGSEGKLSSKAQDFLAKLREQYGDYDFIIADDVNDPRLLDQGTKAYSVILRTDELERMANDEDYAKEVMGKVDSAIGTMKGIEEKGELGEGVQFKRIAISFDDEGNMKLFAELEKMSEQQKERMESAKEKRAEEKKKADKQEEKEKRSEAPAKRTWVEASSEEELLEKLRNINWDEIQEGDGRHPRTQAKQVPER